MVNEKWTDEALLQRIPVIEERVKALSQLIDERDRLYLEKFRASEIAVNAAIVAQKEQTASSFASSEKAIVKAEEAQREYNVRSNEFRGQLDDQAKLLMPRFEVQTIIRGLEEKLEGMRKAQEVQTFRFDQDIKSLRESRQEVVGQNKAEDIGHTRSFATISLAITSFLTMIGLIMVVFRLK